MHTQCIIIIQKITETYDFRRHLKTPVSKHRATDLWHIARRWWICKECTLGAPQHQSKVANYCHNDNKIAALIQMSSHEKVPKQSCNCNIHTSWPFLPASEGITTCDVTTELFSAPPSFSCNSLAWLSNFCFESSAASLVLRASWVAMIQEILLPPLLAQQFPKIEPKKTATQKTKTTTTTTESNSASQTPYAW